MERSANLVRFVRFKRKLGEIIGERGDIGERLGAFDALRDRILGVGEQFEDESIRVIVKPQRELWEEGLRAGGALRGAAQSGGDGEEEEDGEERAAAPLELGEYAAGKWGRYLRAPDLYFEIMREFGGSFVRLGELVTIRRGITSGCDGFFMPWDITREALGFEGSERDFKGRYGGVSREEVRSGAVKIVRDGNGTAHPIEAEYVKPEVHSLRDFQRVEMRSSDCDRVILMVGKDELRKGSWAARYVHYGEVRTFESNKSKAVPVPMRTSCVGRDPWFDLTKLGRPGVAFWPMAHQYRHVIPYNPESLVCNHRMFDVAPGEGIGPRTLSAVLNSTIVASWKTFYGRYTGTEGSLDTEVIDVRMLEIPDLRRISGRVKERLEKAFNQLRVRPIGRLVEEQLMACHSPEGAAKIAAGPIVLPEELQQADRRELDDAVFEMIGVTDTSRRQELVDRLYAAVAAHFREIRVVEIQKMEQRAKSKSRRYTVEELAADAWESVYYKNEPSIIEWLTSWPGSKTLRVIPEGQPRLLDASAMFDREVVYFGKERNAPRVVCGSRAEAELVARMAELGMRGEVKVIAGEEECRELLAQLKEKLSAARTDFDTIASERVSEEKKRAELVAVLMRWRIGGKQGVGAMAARQLPIDKEPREIW